MSEASASTLTLQQEEEKRLSFLASAIAGVQLRVSSSLPAHKLSSCDGAELRLSAAVPPELRRAVCAAHALLVAAHSLRGPSLARLVGRGRASRRYLALELRRALATLGQRLPHQIERLLSLQAQGEVSASAEQSLTWALDRDHAVQELAEAFGTIRAGSLTWARMRGKLPAAPGNTSSSTLAQHDEDDELDRAGSTRKLLTIFTSPLGGGPVADLFLKLLGFGRSSGSDGAEGTEGGGAQALAGDAMMTGPGGADSRQLAVGLPPKLLARDEPRGFCYPEWHETMQRYRPDWVHVLEFPPALQASGTARERARIPRRSLRAQLARVGVELQRHRAQLDGEELDLDRVIRFAVDPDQRAEGARLYTASRRTRRDLTLLVLLDVSQSTADKNQAGESIFGQQRELAREVVRTAHRLGDRVALYGYHSRGRHHVHCLRVKGFSEPFSARTEQRLAALEPGGLSRLGAAVRHATRLLDKETQHSHRLLLVLSDGFAYDDGYERSYAEADTAKALAEASQQGIACVCLNVGSEQDDETLKRLYGSSAYLRCADLSRAVPALRTLIRSAM